MIAIVTGATGFIGAALCRELVESGHKVYAVVRPGSSKIEKLSDLIGPRLEVIKLGLDNLDKLPLQIEQADTFYHLAWNGSAGADREDYKIQLSNLGFTNAAINAAVACGCGSFVGAGSQAEYGVCKQLAVEDDTLANPFMMYGAAKNATCNMGKLLAKQLGIRFIWPRIYSIYGVGENPGTLVNYVIDTLLAGKVPELSPCENMWNFMYITDCVRALRLLGESSNAEGVYHVASKDTRLLKNFVEEIRDIVSPGSELAFGMKISDPARTFWLEPDVKKLDEIGFECEVSFREGIGRKALRGDSDKTYD